uniref:transposase n=1 Tax=Microvirga calopogonii TaxID=2078013 RepID=UPI001478DD8E
KATTAALAQRAHWLRVEWLPKDAPELNAIEERWRDVKQHDLAHQTFAGPEDLDQAIHEAIMKLNHERSRHPLANRRIPLRELGGTPRQTPLADYTTSRAPPSSTQPCLLFAC